MVDGSCSQLMEYGGTADNQKPAVERMAVGIL